MDYAFENLGSRTFEHLTQALALKQMGIAGIVFGDGPDGGREATFNGRTTYDAGDGPWDGYVVMQAKFRQRTEGTTRDGRWLVKELKAELAEFTKKGSRRRVPEYYVVVTNVALGSVQDAGAKDRVFAEIAAAGLDLKGVDIWDYDRLRAMVEGDVDVRRTYAAWITPGDVLSAALEHFESQVPDLEGTLARYLQMELLSDQFANLEQAGHSPDERVPMARVFVDLPVCPPGEDDADGEPFVAGILAAAAERLSASSLKTSPVGDARVVLVGGPGQGKTTLGQFVCQMLRASILDARRATLDPDAEAVVDLVREWCERDGTPLPKVRRFPVRIVLSHFAKLLADESSDVTSVMSYLAMRIATRTDAPLDADTFRRWLGQIPWLLVLDGLDEVPPSSNRDEVLSAIKDFMIQVAEADADVLVLATTRPQGYSQEFSPERYQHRHLVPLQADNALAYGTRLLEVRFGADPDRLERVLTRLESATSNVTTARLMSSPLQVTIMTILVDKQGHPPQERWTLFSSYYGAIYARELERDVTTSRVLRDHKANVDAIHRRVALVLQSESEQAKGTDAQMSEERFRTLVRDRLHGEGYEGEELDALAEEIVDAAANRLVFLVGLEAGVVGFEIRSLQEFMAAEGLMEGSDEQVRRRLTAIATSPSWRNVMLFAVGYCFADRRQYLRDTVYAIAAGLNASDDPALAASLAGSRLAMDILDEGTVRQQPRYDRLFTALALELVALPAGFREPQRTLAALYSPTHAGAYEHAIRERLAAVEGNAASGAWTCLTGLVLREVAWASALCLEAWPQRPEAARPLLPLISHRVADERINALAEREFLRQHASFTLLRSGLGTGFLAHPQSPVWINEARRGYRYRARGGHFMLAVGRLSLGVRLTLLEGFLRSWGPALNTLPAQPDRHPSWDVVELLGQFAAIPDLPHAAAVLRGLVPHLDEPLPTPRRVALGARSWWMGELLPWIFVALTLSARSAEEVLRRADELEAGTYGSVEDWLAREASWTRSETWSVVRSAAAFDPESPLGDVEAMGAFPLAALSDRMFMESWVSTDDDAAMLTDLESASETTRGLAAFVAYRAMDGTLFGSVGDVRILEVWLRVTELSGQRPRNLSLGVRDLLLANAETLDVAMLHRFGVIYEDVDVRPALAENAELRDQLAEKVIAAIGTAPPGEDVGLVKLLATMGVGAPGAGAIVDGRPLPDGDPGLRRAILLLRVAAGISDAETDQSLRAWIVEQPYDATLLHRVGLPLESLIEMLCAADGSAASATDRGAALGALHTAVGRRHTPLADFARWPEFELFMPPPA